jgi:hypothetical protein
VTSCPASRRRSCDRRRRPHVDPHRREVPTKRATISKRVRSSRFRPSWRLTTPIASQPHPGRNATPDGFAARCGVSLFPSTSLASRHSRHGASSLHPRQHLCTVATPRAARRGHVWEGNRRACNPFPPDRSRAASPMRRRRGRKLRSARPSQNLQGRLARHSSVGPSYSLRGARSPAGSACPPGANAGDAGTTSSMGACRRAHDLR